MVNKNYHIYLVLLLVLKIQLPKIITDDIYSDNDDAADGYLIDAELKIDYSMSEGADKKTQEESNEIGGMGALLTQDEYGRILVLEPFPDSSALKAGMEKGDWIIAVDGVSIENMDIDSVVDKIMGPVGSKVAISVYRNDQILLSVCTRQPLPEEGQD